MSEIKIKHEIMLPLEMSSKAVELTRCLLKRGVYARGTSKGFRITWTETEDMNSFIERMNNE